MRFLNPEAAIFFLLIPLMICGWAIHVYQKWQFRSRAGLNQHLRPLSRFSTWRRETMSLLAGVLGIGLLVTAATRPQLYREIRKPVYDKADLVLVLDMSVSMLADDVKPTRFSRAILEIEELLAHKPDTIDRIGLVGFSGASLMLSSLTRDMDKLVFYLDWLQTDFQPQYGTNIGGALFTARDLVRKNQSVRRAIFLIVSDGDDQGYELQRALDIFRREARTIYTVGIGGDQETAIPSFAPEGQPDGDGGQILMTQFDGATLRDIASATGGRFIRSTTGRDLTAALLDLVDRERKVIGYTATSEDTDLYRGCLAAAAGATFLLLLAL